MKICFLVSNIFTLGGVQRVVSSLATELSKSCKVDIVCTEDNVIVDKQIYDLSNDVNIVIREELLDSNYRNSLYSKVLRRINRKVKFLDKNIFNDLLVSAYYPKSERRAFINYINSNNYDIVIGVEGKYSILLGLISSSINSKTIGWQHNSYEAYFSKYRQYLWHKESLFKKYVPLLGAYIVLTNYDKNKILSEKSVHTQVIYNPLSFTSELKSECKNKQILFVGRLVEEQKGLDLLIEAFKQISYYEPEWRLCIVGDGEDREKLINLIKANKLEENIELHQFTNDVKSFYRNSSIFISTSRWEGFGLVITEAMECGLPVVAFRNSGPQEIINKNNVNGILVENGNVNELVKSVLNLIRDEKVLIEMSKESIKRAKDFSIEETAQEWINLFNKLV